MGDYTYKKMYRERYELYAIFTEVSVDFRDKVLDKSGGKCAECGADITLKTMMIDYIVPLRHGGTGYIDNLQGICPKCELTKVDKILSKVSNPLIESAAKLWIQSFIKSPIWTFIVSLLIGLATSFSIWYIDQANYVSAPKPVSIEFKAQLDQLDETEKSLKTLLSFVESQRKSAIENEQKIQQLITEKEKLEPLVNADKAVVEALFIVQESRAAQNAQRERWIGFGLGILASVVASFLIAVGKYFLATRRERS
ncbi:HNH endonuclease [Vibrio vulnificus]|nr:HNH endonuclease [Vibrio vulnificus]